MGLIANDFIVDSNQHCFLCLAQISQSANHPPVKVEPGSQYSQSQSVHSPPIYSIQYLSRYVEVEMFKVFNYDDAAAIPPHLLDKVRRSKLKVELCGDCAHLNANFSKRIRQLEKLEMELGVSLSSILDKLLVAGEMGREGKFQMLKDQKSTGSSAFAGVKGKLEIMQALRKDVMEKSSKKLAAIPPRVSIPKPNSNRKMNMNKIKFTGRISTTNFTNAVHGYFKTTEAWEDAIEPIPPSSQECQPTEEIACTNVNVRMMPPPPVPVNTSPISSNAASSSSSKQTVEDYACDICGMTFMFPGNLQFHSRVVHNTKITRSTILSRSGLTLKTSKILKWTCRRCGSVFVHWKDFQRHLKSAHANELGHVCKNCGLKFGTKRQLKTHRRLEHNHKSKSSEVITPDDPNDNLGDYSPAATVLGPVSEDVPDLETVETRIVKMESNYDPLVVVPLSSAEAGSREISATSSNSHPHNEEWLTGLSQLSKAVGECKGSNAPSEMECDICHLMVTDISTHLYTVHFEQSGGS